MIIINTMSEIKLNGFIPDVFIESVFCKPIGGLHL